MRITDAQNEHCLQIILEEAFGYKAEYARKLAIWSDSLPETDGDLAINPKKADLDALGTAQDIVNRIFDRGWGGERV